MVRTPRFAGALLVPLVAAVASTACVTKQTLPAGRGRIEGDLAAPAGVAAHDAPRWRDGDRFVYARAGVSVIAVRVAATEAGYELVDEATGRRTVLGPDLAERGEREPGDDGLTLAFDPEDAALAWPLFAGKRWGSEFTSRKAGRDDLPFVAEYWCDVEEEVRVPAGTFRALRIWRRARLAVPGRFPERVSVTWYSPELGAVVKRLADGLETVLVEARRR